MIGIDPYSVLLFNRVQTRVNIINDDATNRNISACPHAKNAFSVNQLMYIYNKNSFSRLKEIIILAFFYACTIFAKLIRSCTYSKVLCLGTNLIHQIIIGYDINSGAFSFI